MLEDHGCRCTCTPCQNGQHLFCNFRCDDANWRSEEDTDYEPPMKPCPVCGGRGTSFDRLRPCEACDGEGFIENC